MKTFKITTFFALLLLFFSCTPSLSGTYKGVGSTFFDQLTFKSGNKVELVFMGSTTEVEYKLEEGKVKITNAGQTQVLTITEDGCLDGGGFVGKYCK
ncbi:MAG: hypothetical protein R2816_12380 [Flavobacteriaceae bacterium]|nr:hypothetical protein [Flavobacteriaceae bacterium]